MESTKQAVGYIKTWQDYWHVYPEVLSMEGNDNIPTSVRINLFGFFATDAITQLKQKKANKTLEKESRFKHKILKSFQRHPSPEQHVQDINVIREELLYANTMLASPYPDDFFDRVCDSITTLIYALENRHWPTHVPVDQFPSDREFEPDLHLDHISALNGLVVDYANAYQPENRNIWLVEMPVLQTTEILTYLASQIKKHCMLGKAQQNQTTFSYDYIGCIDTSALDTPEQLRTMLMANMSARLHLPALAKSSIHSLAELSRNKLLIIYLDADSKLDSHYLNNHQHQELIKSVVNMIEHTSFDVLLVAHDTSNVISREMHSPLTPVSVHLPVHNYWQEMRTEYEKCGLVSDDNAFYEDGVPLSYDNYLMMEMLSKVTQIYADDPEITAALECNIDYLMEACTRDDDACINRFGFAYLQHQAPITFLVLLILTLSSNELTKHEITKMIGQLLRYYIGKDDVICAQFSYNHTKNKLFTSLGFEDKEHFLKATIKTQEEAIYTHIEKSIELLRRLIVKRHRVHAVDSGDGIYIPVRLKERLGLFVDTHQRLQFIRRSTHWLIACLLDQRIAAMAKTVSEEFYSNQALDPITSQRINQLNHALASVNVSMGHRETVAFIPSQEWMSTCYKFDPAKRLSAPDTLRKCFQLYDVIENGDGHYYRLSNSTDFNRYKLSILIRFFHCGFKNRLDELSNNRTSQVLPGLNMLLLESISDRAIDLYTAAAVAAYRSQDYGFLEVIIGQSKSVANLCDYGNRMHLPFFIGEINSALSSKVPFTRNIHIESLRVQGLIRRNSLRSALHCNRRVVASLLGLEHIEGLKLCFEQVDDTVQVCLDAHLTKYLFKFLMHAMRIALFQRYISGTVRIYKILRYLQLCFDHLASQDDMQQYEVQLPIKTFNSSRLVILQLTRHAIHEMTIPAIGEATEIIRSASYLYSSMPQEHPLRDDIALIMLDIDQRYRDLSVGQVDKYHPGAATTIVNQQRLSLLQHYLRLCKISPAELACGDTVLIEQKIPFYKQNFPGVYLKTQYIYLTVRAMLCASKDKVDNAHFDLLRQYLDYLRTVSNDREFELFLINIEIMDVVFHIARFAHNNTKYFLSKQQLRYSAQHYAAYMREKEKALNDVVFGQTLSGEYILPRLERVYRKITTSGYLIKLTEFNRVVRFVLNDYTVPDNQITSLLKSTSINDIQQVRWDEYGELQSGFFSFPDQKVNVAEHESNTMYERYFETS